MCTGNRIGDEGAKDLRKFASVVQQQRKEKRKQHQEAIILILWSYRFSEESAFHVLPLEMIHMIIRFVLNDMPATLDVQMQ